MVAVQANTLLFQQIWFHDLKKSIIVALCFPDGLLRLEGQVFCANPPKRS